MFSTQQCPPRNVRPPVAGGRGMTVFRGNHAPKMPGRVDVWNRFFPDDVMQAGHVPLPESVRGVGGEKTDSRLRYACVYGFRPAVRADTVNRVCTCSRVLRRVTQSRWHRVAEVRCSPPFCWRRRWRAPRNRQVQNRNNIRNICTHPVCVHHNGWLTFFCKMPKCSDQGFKICSRVRKTNYVFICLSNRYIK